MPEIGSTSPNSRAGGKVDRGAGWETKDSSGTMPGSDHLQSLAARSPDSPCDSRSQFSILASPVLQPICAPLRARRDEPCACASSFSRPSVSPVQSLKPCLRRPSMRAARWRCRRGVARPPAIRSACPAAPPPARAALHRPPTLQSRAPPAAAWSADRPHFPWTLSALPQARSKAVSPTPRRSDSGDRALPPPAVQGHAQEFAVALGHDGAIRVHRGFRQEFAPAPAPLPESGNVAEISKMRVLRTSATLSTLFFSDSMERVPSSRAQISWVMAF